ncbi:hypothetical protein [Streptomyces meridianus]|uniref:Uncharacterized protein n=1 Tax=Streptomyces meridianus TaxID=2938945 RepID=A0ABT0X1I8_9ACTN|nr:hypothetical protein [Streptomyces meridianus]MCM2576344.1 hypothetical protein [Streptomyces meridianus]
MVDLSAAREFRPVYHPAGFDVEVRIAWEDLQMGRWMSTRDLLARTGADWTLRTARTQVLAIAAAGSNVISAWQSEEPESRNARVMGARVAVERAIRAHRRDADSAPRLEHEARRTAELAADFLPADPVPFVCLLALARLDEQQQHPEHRLRAAEPMLPAGPWGLLQEVVDRDPFNREGFHRVLQFFLSRAGSPERSLAPAVEFARWVGSWAPAGSALQLLPLYAQVEQHRRQTARSVAECGRAAPLQHRQWADDPVVRYTLRAFHDWFRTPAAAESPRSVTDLSQLAYALWAAHRYVEAAEVFTALGPYATHEPWGSLIEPGHQDTAEESFLRARIQSLSAVSPLRTRAESSRKSHAKPRLA